jgi:hypothetical protein
LQDSQIDAVVNPSVVQFGIVGIGYREQGSLRHDFSVGLLPQARRLGQGGRGQSLVIEGAGFRIVKEPEGA